MKIEFLENEQHLSFNKQDILIIDPCYIDGELETSWSEFCDKMADFTNNYSRRLHNVCVLNDDIKLLVVDTAYGDGCYRFNPTGLSDDRYVGTECGVDAGMLCVISLEDAKKLNPNVDTTSGVVVKNFSYDVDSDGKGNIISPSFEIYTDDSDIENDDDDDDFY
jgi:hypothetical protein